MNNKQVIKPINLPPKIPLFATAVAYLFLDKFNATEWVWGMVITFFVIVWVVNIKAIFDSTFVDIFEKVQKK